MMRCIWLILDVLFQLLRVNKSQYNTIWYDNMDTNNGLWSDTYGDGVHFNYVSQDGCFDNTCALTETTDINYISGISRATNITGYSSIRLQFDLCAYMIEPEDRCNVYYAYDTVATKILINSYQFDFISSGVYDGYEYVYRPLQNETIDLPLSPSSTRLWIFFQIQHKDTTFYSDHCYWDNVYLKGTLLPSTPSQVPTDFATTKVTTLFIKEPMTTTTHYVTTTTLTTHDIENTTVTSVRSSGTATIHSVSMLSSTETAETQIVSNVVGIVTETSATKIVFDNAMVVLFVICVAVTIAIGTVCGLFLYTWMKQRKAVVSDPNKSHKDTVNSVSIGMVNKDEDTNDGVTEGVHPLIKADEFIIKGDDDTIAVDEGEGNNNMNDVEIAQDEGEQYDTLQIQDIQHIQM